MFYVGSSVVDWPLEARALLRTAMKFVLVSIFLFYGGLRFWWCDRH